MFSFEYAYQIFVLNNNNAFRYLRRNASFFCFPREMLFFIEMTFVNGRFVSNTRISLGIFILD